MLAPKNVIYGFCKTTCPPKPKYMISLYRSEELNVVACFTTSQKRAGVSSEKIKHGRIANEKKEVLSYVFLPEVSVGKTPSGEAFHFPVQTVVRFDYCFKEEQQSKLLSSFDNPEVVCILDDVEYENLIYAMYKSDDTPLIYKTYFEKILFELGQKEHK